MCAQTRRRSEWSWIGVDGELVGESRLARFHDAPQALAGQHWEWMVDSNVCQGTRDAAERVEDEDEDDKDVITWGERGQRSVSKIGQRRYGRGR